MYHVCRLLFDHTTVSILLTSNDDFLFETIWLWRSLWPKMAISSLRPYDRVNSFDLKWRFPLWDHTTITILLTSNDSFLFETIRPWQFFWPQTTISSLRPYDRVTSLSPSPFFLLWSCLNHNVSLVFPTRDLGRRRCLEDVFCPHAPLRAVSKRKRSRSGKIRGIFMIIKRSKIATTFLWLLYPDVVL